VSLERREFLKLAAAGPAALAAGCRASAPAAPAPELPAADSLELCGAALDEATRLGASYADCRLVTLRRQELRTRERRVVSVRDSEERGAGVRVLVNGTWGFAASPRLTRDELPELARQAVQLARSCERLQREPVRLASPERHVAVWRTPLRRDPFDVPLDEKLERLLALNAAALALPGISFVSSSFDFVREHKFFASSDGSAIEQTLQRCNPGFTLTAVDRERGSFETRDSFAAPRAEGYEYIEGYPWQEELERAAEELSEKARAASVEPGVRTLLLHPTNLWLVIHESIGHPTEYDRAIGLEANYAGTSFLTPDKLGNYRVASERCTFVAEKTAPGSLATAGYDDDGMQTRSWPLIRAGLFVDYQLTREQAPLLGRAAGHACSQAQSWKDVPFQRMPNINLLPDESQRSLADLIADCDDAILVQGRGSYSIDHQRYNFQFGGQTFHQIKGGRVRGMLRDVAYQARTPDFWRSCDALTGAGDYHVGGSFYDGKGEPGQVNAVSHGCPAARFRGIDVLNTARRV
jgi:TldD protein